MGEKKASLYNFLVYNGFKDVIEESCQISASEIKSRNSNTAWKNIKIWHNR